MLPLIEKGITYLLKFGRSPPPSPSGSDGSVVSNDARSGTKDFYQFSHCTHSFLIYVSILQAVLAVIRIIVGAHKYDPKVV